MFYEMNAREDYVRELETEMNILSGLDLDSIWEYMNPKCDITPPEYFLACEDFACNPYSISNDEVRLVDSREIRLMLERAGCLDAVL